MKAVGPVEGPELHARVSLCYQFLRQVARGIVGCPVVLQRAGFTYIAVTGPALFGRLTRRAASVRGAAAAVVDAHGLASLAAQQLPDRPSTRLAQYVPQGQINRAQSPQFGAPRTECARPFVEKPPVVFNGKRVAAQQPAGHPVMDHRGDRLGDVVGFAVADCAGIGVDP